MDGHKPLLIYDGDCGFCVYWVNYWRKLTGERVRYAPFQDVAAEHPTIPRAEFERAIQYVAPDGSIASAAEASFLTLSHAPGRRIWLVLYRHLPGFAALAEAVYAFIAARRPAFYSLSVLLWGKHYAPPQFNLVSALFVRCVGLAYLAAFISFAVQALGLIGSHGILPLSDYLDTLRTTLGPIRYWLLPTAFWLNSSDGVIQAVPWIGAALAMLLVLGLIPRTALILSYALYLSVFYAGQTFMSFQWDLYLLEIGFLAVVLTVAAVPGIWLLRWLLFRFMFLSGTVKLMSGDPTWRNFTALYYHFHTQPLPTPLAWYADKLPPACLSFGTGATLFIELVLPFLIFCPRRLRFVAAFGFLLLQACIVLTGNYNFFNLLTMALCLVLFDDVALAKIIPARAIRVLGTVRPLVQRSSLPITVAALFIAFVGWVQMEARLGGRPSAVGISLAQLIAPLNIANSYGLFAEMTVRRPEIVIEGSDDGVTWEEYTFKYKPGDVMRPPRWNIPHQPRVDWQMWFAALGQTDQNWFAKFLARILENSPQVIAVFAHNPFPDHPPRYVQALLYDYRFATTAEHKTDGAWWHRDLLGVYYPPVSLKTDPNPS